MLLAEDDRAVDEPQVTLDGTVLTEVMKMLVEELSQRFSCDRALRLMLMRGDDDIENDALTTVCARAGVSAEAYCQTLRSHPALFELHRAALSEVLVGSTDPGPNDQISRESPSGTEANSHYNDWMARGNSP